MLEQNKSNFYYRTNSVKIKHHFLINSKIRSWPIFPILEAQNFFRKIRLLHTTSHGFLAPCQNLEKTNGTIPRKCTNWKIEGRADPISLGPSSYQPESKKAEWTHECDVREIILMDLFRTLDTFCALVLLLTFLVLFDLIRSFGSGYWRMDQVKFAEYSL